MYWHVTYGYKDHYGTQTMSVGSESTHTEAQARAEFYRIRPADVGWRIISMKPH